MKWKVLKWSGLAQVGFLPKSVVIDRVAKWSAPWQRGGVGICILSDGLDVNPEGYSGNEFSRIPLGSTLYTRKSRQRTRVWSNPPVPVPVRYQWTGFSAHGGKHQVFAFFFFLLSATSEHLAQRGSIDTTPIFLGDRSEYHFEGLLARLSTGVSS